MPFRPICTCTVRYTTYAYIRDIHIYEMDAISFFVKQRLFYKVDGDFDTIGLMVTLCVAFLKVLQKSIRVQLDKAPGV